MFAGYYIHQLHYLFSIKYSKNFNKKYEEWQKISSFKKQFQEIINSTKKIKRK